MKKRVVSFLLALLMVVATPAETVCAMPAEQNSSMEIVTLADDEDIVALTEEEQSESEEAQNEENSKELQDTSEEQQEEDVTPTQQPTEVPSETPDDGENEDVETEEPTKQPVEDDVEEETETPTELPTETPVLEEEETPAPTETATPSATPSESPTAEPTEAPTETPTESPSATPMPSTQKSVKVAEGNLEIKAVGSNGIAYEDVAYLSVRTVNSLPDDVANEYYKICDEIASWKESGLDCENIVISVDKKGNLELSLSIPMETLLSETAQEEFLTEENCEEQLEEAVEEQTTDEEAVEEEKTQDGDEEEQIESEENSETVEETVEETEEETAEEAVEETEVETLDEAETIEDASETATEETTEKGVIISENIELAKAQAVKIEDVTSDSLVEFDTNLADGDYFKKQLSSGEKKLYEAGKSAMVKGGKNGFSYSGSERMSSGSSFCNAVSALVNTYPNSFNWIDFGGGQMHCKWGYSGGKYKYIVSIDKSKHYSSSLEKQAKAKVKTLVANAKTYATKNYPGNYIYGMVTYFDKWICENNYYNNVGTYYSQRKTAEYFYCHSCYGILLKGYGVCQSYALAMTRLLDAAGIRNMYVVGTGNGGGHAWNYVQMPDGKWYLLDSTWNDSGSSSSKSYFLIGSSADGGKHSATGKTYTLGDKFKFYTLASAKYNSNTEKNYLNGITLSKTTVGIKPNGTCQLKIKKPSSSLSSYYYKKYAKSWSSSNTAVATVSKSGKVKGVKPGKAVITYTIAGIKKTCTVYVYQITGLTFSNNSKSTYKATYANPDTVFNSKDTFTVKIAVNQKNKTMTAADIKSSVGLSAPTVTSSKKSVATATAALSGDTITLTVTPYKIGSTKITVKFGGKTATYNLSVKYQLKDAWFAANSKYSAVEYTGKAHKPKVLTTSSIDAKAKYSVKYTNNKNAGTATITITGTGNYSGTVKRTFTIKPKSITTANFKSCTASAYYNGTTQAPKTTVKLGSKTLKAGKDYTISYKVGSKAATPTAVNTYKVYITGTGNYTGTVSTTKTFVIKALPLNKVKATCSSTVKYNSGKAVTPPTITVKYGKKVIPAANYTVTYQDKDGNVVKAANLKAKGTYKAIITPKGSNLVAGTKVKTITKTFKIK